MSLHQVDVEKLLETEYWTNRYFIDVPNVSAGIPVGQAIVDFERRFHSEGVLFTKIRVSDAIPNNDNFVILTLNVAGLDGPSGDYLPLFNCVRMDLAPAIGRASRKFYRAPIREGEQVGGFLTEARLNALNALIPTYLYPITELCDPDLQPFSQVAFVRTVAMRQLRRGSRRRTQSII